MLNHPHQPRNWTVADRQLSLFLPQTLDILTESNNISMVCGTISVVNKCNKKNKMSSSSSRLLADIQAGCFFCAGAAAWRTFVD